MYPEHLTKPMSEQLSSNGFKELKSAEEVDAMLKEKGTHLLVVNSVCGCAAGAARPGVLMAVKESEKVPTLLSTVFAGVDAEATKKAREYMAPFPPSSPSIAFFRDGELVHCVERHHIEGRSAEMLAGHLKEVFNEFC